MIGNGPSGCGHLSESQLFHPFTVSEEMRSTTMPGKKGLSTRIEASLQADERLAGHPIMATVRKGVVKLKGMVPDHRCRMLAEMIATSFDECDEVVNDLVVEMKEQRPDEELLETVRSVLDSHPDVSSGVINVQVQDGIVTLHGNIVGPWERSLVENAAGAVSGVRDICNEVVVDLAKSMKDESLCTEIQSALAENADGNEEMVRVAVTNTTACLSGQVPTMSQKQLAETVAQQAGALRVQSDIIVAGQSR
jgi:osmotically-inducible protein OsmY